MNRLEVDLGEVRDLVIQGGKTALVLKPFAIIGQGDVGPLSQESTGEFQGQGEPTQQATDGFGLVAFRVVGLSRTA